MERAALFASVLLAAAPLAPNARVLRCACPSRDVTGDQSPPYFGVEFVTSRVPFPKGDPPCTVTAEIADNEFAFVVPYSHYEVMIDRRSGMVLTRGNRRIWAGNGTCTACEGQLEETPC